MSGAFRLKPLDLVTALSFAVYASSATVTPISLVMLARELQFSLAGGGVVEVIRTTLLVLALVGSGWAAAHWGKATSLGMSSVILGAGLLAYALAPAYGVVLLAVAFVGLGGGVIEALLNPLVQDLHPHDSGRYLNFLNAFFSLGVFITVLGGGELLTRGGSWRVIMATLAVLCIVSGALFLLLRRTVADVESGEAAPGESITAPGESIGAPSESITAPSESITAPDHAVAATRDTDVAPGDSAALSRRVLADKLAVVRHPRFWVFFAMMFLGAGAEGGLTFWSASYIQLHFGALPRLGGLGTAAFALGMIVGRVGSGWFVPQHRLWHLIFASAVLGAGVGIATPAVVSVGALLGLLFVAGLSIACFWPSIQSYAVDRTPLEPTALFILLSIGGIPGLGFASWLMGVIGEQAGLNASLYVIPAFLSVLALLAVAERLRPPRDSSSSHR